MKIRFLQVFAPLLCAGCISSAPEEPRNWLIGPARVAESAAAEPKWESARISRIDVCAPYDDRRLAVLRRDGSIAFDPFNAFAAAPSALLKEAAFETLSRSGHAKASVGARSAAAASRSIEITVTRLALDCRAEGRRDATVSLSAALVSGRDLVSFARAEASAPTDGGDFTAAYSEAFCRALSDALGRL